MIRQAFALALFFLPIPTNAGPLSYRCELLEIINSNGWSQQALKSWRNIAKSEDLVVDRKSGRIIHNIFGNGGMKSIVMHPGDGGWSFKTMAYSGEISLAGHVTYLEVDEFAEGLDKPMRIIGSSFVATGLCR